MTSTMYWTVANEKVSGGSRPLIPCSLGIAPLLEMGLEILLHRKHAYRQYSDHIYEQWYIICQPLVALTFRA